MRAQERERKVMENQMMDTSPGPPVTAAAVASTLTNSGMELPLPDFGRVYHSAPPETLRPSVIKSRKKIMYDINNNKNIFDANFDNNHTSNKTKTTGTTRHSSHPSENWYVPGYNVTTMSNFPYENSFLTSSSNNVMACSSFLYDKRSIDKTRRDSLDSIPPLEDTPEETVKVQVGIDDDLQMILDLDPSIVDMGSTPTITISDQTVTGLPPITGGYVLFFCLFVYKSFIVNVLVRP